MLLVPTKIPQYFFVSFYRTPGGTNVERALFILDNFTDNILRYRYNKVPSGVG